MPEFQVFINPPRIEGDPRQAFFGKVLDHMLEDAEEFNIVKATGLVGFRASYIDLGYLQDCACEYWFANLPGREEMEKILWAEMPRVVQRLKYMRFKWTESHLTVTFKTKDDRGWYVYEFGPNIQIDPRPGRHLKAVEGSSRSER